MFKTAQFTAAIIAVSCMFTYALPVMADKKEQRYDQGCADARNGTFDESKRKHEQYMKGWKACKDQGHSSASTGASAWDRGCSDAKVGSYDRSNHSDAYEEGWQSCNREKQSAGNNDRREWERGCEDAKVGSYDRSMHSDAYEEGWQDCNKNR